MFKTKDPQKNLEYIYYYKTMFEALGVRLLFTHLECGVLVQLNVARTQLPQNSWAFIRCFEILMEYLNVELSLNIFFILF